MSKLTKALEKIGSNAQLKTVTLKKVSNKLYQLGVSKSLTKVLIDKESNKLRRITKARINMCCYIIRPPTALEVFSKPLNTIMSYNSNKPVLRCKSIA